MHQARSAPNNKVRPTLLFIAGFIAGWALHGWLEFYIDGGGASVLQRALGAMVIGGGIAITWWALSTFVRVRTGIMPDRPARQLVTFGRHAIMCRPAAWFDVPELARRKGRASASDPRRRSG